jgi:hypothetical protein
MMLHLFVRALRVLFVVEGSEVSAKLGLEKWCFMIAVTSSGKGKRGEGLRAV